jgi:hypothetical protein
MDMPATKPVSMVTVFRENGFDKRIADTLRQVCGGGRVIQTVHDQSAIWLALQLPEYSIRVKAMTDLPIHGRQLRRFRLGTKQAVWELKLAVSIRMSFDKLDVAKAASTQIDLANKLAEVTHWPIFIEQASEVRYVVEKAAAQHKLKDRATVIQQKVPCFDSEFNPAGDRTYYSLGIDFPGSH